MSNVTRFRAPAPELPSLPFRTGTTPHDIEMLLDAIDRARKRIEIVIERLRPVLAAEIARLDDDTLFVDWWIAEAEGGWLHTLHARFVTPLTEGSVLSQDWNSRWAPVQGAIIDIGEHLADWSTVARRADTMIRDEWELDERLCSLVGEMGHAEIERRQAAARR